MPIYKVSGEPARVPPISDSSLQRVAEALLRLGFGPNALEQFRCSINADGSVNVVDLDGKVQMQIGADADVSDIDFEIPHSFSSLAADELAADEFEPPPELKDLDADLTPPPRSLGWDVAVPDDRLALAMERSDQILTAPDIQSACRLALRIVTDAISADAGAVLLREARPGTLRFIAATGPRGPQVLDTTMPSADGIAGFAFGFGVSVVVRNAVEDGRYAWQIDRASGYRTQSLLAVPIRVTCGPIFGCLELLNAPDGFQAGDVEIARVVASALGGRLRAPLEYSNASLHA